MKLTYYFLILNIFDSCYYKIQLPTFSYTQLLNKPYGNEFTLREQNPNLKCCQPLELLTHFEKRSRPFNTGNMGSVGQGAAKLLSIKL